jgi:hypothetical protein
LTGEVRIKKVPWNLSAFHGTQGRRIVTSAIRFRLPDVQSVRDRDFLMFDPPAEILFPSSVRLFFRRILGRLEADFLEVP